MAKLVIWYDDQGESPRDWDNLATFIAGGHKVQHLADKDAKSELLDAIRSAKNYKDSMEYDYDLTHVPTMVELADKLGLLATRLPLYAYIHSGETISTTPFSCPWDSGQYGEAFITKEKARSEYGVKRISKQLVEKMNKIIEGEVETLDQRLQNDVYGFSVVDDDGEVIDSCGGFYGTDWEQNGIKSHIDEKYHHLIEDATQNIMFHSDIDYDDLAA